ncbi:MAG: nucleoside:proton symporter [Acidobacteriota bacterium]|nr:MAG: nucleoside:proton symporter [Acidobacteriota bacterium]
MLIQSAAGLAVFLLIAWALSESRRKVSFRLVMAGLGLQLLLALILLKIPVSRELFLALNRLILSLEESTQAGTAFVFGYLGGATAPFETITPAASYVLAFRALPLLLLISALTTLLFYWRILPVVVTFFSKALERTLKIGGAEGVGVGANIFMGMVESPLFIRPYLASLTRSELFTIMTCGMATIAGTVMVLYASLLSEAVPNVLGHILTASILNAPAAVVISKIMIPQIGDPTPGKLVAPEEIHNAMDAITKGTVRGVQLLLNIVAMLIVLVALVHLANLMLALLPEWGGSPLTLQRIMGLIMFPIVWLMGVPSSEAMVAGSLMGTKTIVNELVAYLDMSQLQPGALSEKSRLIMIYAMCGFANPGSLGIMIGGLGTMAPERRDEIVGLGFRSIVAGTLSTCLTGAWVGLLGVS